jgi:hypothetical protein
VAIAAAAALALSGAAAGASEGAARYPDIAGTWMRPGAAQWDPTKPAGLRQQAPLTAHYASIGTETYFISADGYLMPTKKNQTVPRLEGFDPSPK